VSEKGVGSGGLNTLVIRSKCECVPNIQGQVEDGCARLELKSPDDGLGVVRWYAEKRVPPQLQSEKVRDMTG